MRLSLWFLLQVQLTIMYSTPQYKILVCFNKKAESQVDVQKVCVVFVSLNMCMCIKGNVHVYLQSTVAKYSAQWNRQQNWQKEKSHVLLT